MKLEYTSIQHTLRVTQQSGFLVPWIEMYASRFIEGALAGMIFVPLEVDNLDFNPRLLPNRDIHMQDHDLCVRMVCIKWV